MAEIRTADIVLSLTGRDRGQLMLVVAEEGDFLLLANGRARRAENPKRKRRKHVSLQGPCDERTRLKLQSESRLTNSEIRKALALCLMLCSRSSCPTATRFWRISRASSA